MSKLKLVILVGMLSILLAAGCAAPQADETYCQDLQDIANAVDQYAEIDRPSAETEVMEDLNEMGATERCPGYNPAEADKDG
jgi:outer membrane murein-binding lipoprotein Lpp